MLAPTLFAATRPGVKASVGVSLTLHIQDMRTVILGASSSLLIALAQTSSHLHFSAAALFCSDLEHNAPLKQGRPFPRCLPF